MREAFAALLALALPTSAFDTTSHYKYAEMLASPTANGGQVTLSPELLEADFTRVRLPDGRTVTVRRQSRSADGSYKTWVGEALGYPGSQVVVASVRGTMIATIVLLEQEWEVAPSGQMQLMSYATTHGNDDMVFADQPAEALDEHDTTGIEFAEHYTIDVMLLYTDKVEKIYGKDRIEAKIIGAAAAANQAYRNSGLNFSLRIVGLRGIYGYNESGDMDKTLSDLQGTYDFSMDYVHDWRNRLGADIVSLVSMDFDACGIGGVMRELELSEARYAFNIVAPHCLSNQTLAHEIGHNMGSRHDRGHSPAGGGVFPFSYGYQHCLEGQALRDIMSYPCPNSVSRGARLAYFSSPKIVVNGIPLGIDHSRDPKNSADNVRSMQLAAPVVAAFRPTKVLSPDADTYAGD